jgi:hypothetical protein
MVYLVSYFTSENELQEGDGLTNSQALAVLSVDSRAVFTNYV